MHLFASFVLVLCATTVAWSASVLSAQHGAANVNSGDMRFEAALYIVTFDEDVALGSNGPTLSSLPLAVSTTFSSAGGHPQVATDGSLASNNDGENGPGMPDAMFAQANTAELRCPCPSCSVGPEYPECDTAQCVYTSDMQMGSHGAPRGLMPMPAVRESAATLFSIFAGTLNASAVEPLENTFIGIKIVREYNNGLWNRHIPPEVDSSKCTVHFSDGALRWVQTNATFTGNVATGVPTAYAPVCDPAALADTITKLSEAVEQLSVPVDGRQAMERRTWNLASFQLRDAWVGCAALVNTLTVRGPVERTTPGSRACHHEPHTAAWSADPCCNHGRSFTECCAPRATTFTVDGLVGISGQHVSSTCATPASTEAALRAFVRNQGAAAECDARAREMGADWEVTRNLMRFVDTCYEELFGRNGQPPTCISDDNCYTSCDKQRGECVQPHDNPDPYLLECFADHINSELERAWRRDWGLTGQSSSAEFAAAFQSNLYTSACVGPTAWQHNEHWESAPVESCEQDDHYCHCWIDPMAARAGLLQRAHHPAHRAHISQQVNGMLYASRNATAMSCWRSWLVPANQTACLADQQCNWDRARNATECTDPAFSSEFCGDCHAGECWPVTQPSMCYTWVENPATCSAMGGLQGPWGSWHCMFPTLTTEEQCLPTALCGTRPDISIDKEAALGDRWCPARCIYVLATNETQCVEQGPHAWWSSGDSSCNLHLWGQQCIDHGNTTWFSGRNFQPGQFETQSACDAGRCSIDPRMSPAECTAYSACTKPCTKCRPRDWGKTLCSNTALSETECTQQQNGEWDATHGVCIFDSFRSAGECNGANATNVFEACETLSDANCVAETGLSTLAQDRLECYVNRWDHCETQQSCEATGVCDDWDFQNWHNPQCWNNGVDSAKAVQCTGACVTPFDLTRGWPDCNWNSGETLGWSRLGCVNYDILDTGACAAVNGTWHPRAFDAVSCAAHGAGCSEPNWWQLTPKQDAVCTSCGGTPKPYYHWSAGTWITGEMIPLTWTARAYSSINAWQPTLDWEKLRKAVERVAMQVVARAIKSAAQCKYNLLAATLLPVACDCGTGPRVGCFDGNSGTFVPIGEQEFFSGIGGSVSWANMRLEVSGEAISADQDSEVISASSSLDAVLLVTSTQAQQQRRYRSLRSPYDPNEYEVVTNHDDYIVGQLVGNGVTLVLPENLTEPVLLCIDVDQDIPRDPEAIYPTADFAGYNASYYGPGQPKWWPLNLPVNIVGDHIQYCANVSESGTFFPILRLDNWETATGVATTTTTTVSPTTTTATSTVAPSSSLSIGAIIAIAVSALVALGAVILIIIIRNADTVYPVYAQARVNTSVYQTARISRRYPHRIKLRKRV